MKREHAMLELFQCKSIEFSLEKLARAAKVPRNQLTFTNVQQMHHLAKDFCSQ